MVVAVWRGRILVASWGIDRVGSQWLSFVMGAIVVGIFLGGNTSVENILSRSDEF